MRQINNQRTSMLILHHTKINCNEIYLIKKPDFPRIIVQIVL